MQSKKATHAIHPGIINCPILGRETLVNSFQIAFAHKIPLGDWITWTPSIAKHSRWEDFTHLFPEPGTVYPQGDEHERFRDNTYTQRSEKIVDGRERARLLKESLGRVASARVKPK